MSLSRLSTYSGRLRSSRISASPDTALLCMNCKKLFVEDTNHDQACQWHKGVCIINYMIHSFSIVFFFQWPFFYLHPYIPTFTCSFQVHVILPTVRILILGYIFWGSCSSSSTILQWRNNFAINIQFTDC